MGIQGELDLGLSFDEEEETLLNEKDQRKLERAIRLESKISAGITDSKIVKVGLILSHFPETRDSDIALQLRYWEEYQSDIYNGGAIYPEDLFRLERLTSISRARAKIQNEYGLYLSKSEKVRRQRKQKEDVEREIQIAMKPDPTKQITLYCDESGKTDKYILVGSMWVAEYDRIMMIKDVIYKFKQDNQIDYEFHFSKVGPGHKDMYLKFFTEVLRKVDNISFKAIVVERSTIKGKSVEDIIIDLYTLLVEYGIEYDKENFRIQLPRRIHIYKDKDRGTDKTLYLERFRQQLQSLFSSKFDNQLVLNNDQIYPVESKYSPHIQLADIFAGCVSRVLNNQGNNHKDLLAKEILEYLGIKIDGTDVTHTKDVAMVKIIR